MSKLWHYIRENSNNAVAVVCPGMGKVAAAVGNFITPGVQPASEYIGNMKYRCWHNQCPSVEIFCISGQNFF